MTDDPWIRANFIEDGVRICRCTRARSTIGSIRGLSEDKRGQEAQGGQSIKEEHGAVRSEERNN